MGEKTLTGRQGQTGGEKVRLGRKRSRSRLGEKVKVGEKKADWEKKSDWGRTVRPGEQASTSSSPGVESVLGGVWEEKSERAEKSRVVKS